MFCVFISLWHHVASCDHLFHVRGCLRDLHGVSCSFYFCCMLSDFFIWGLAYRYHQYVQFYGCLQRYSLVPWHATPSTWCKLFILFCCMLGDFFIWGLAYRYHNKCISLNRGTVLFLASDLRDWKSSSMQTIIYLIGGTT